MIPTVVDRKLSPIDWVLGLVSALTISFRIKVGNEIINKSSSALLGINVKKNHDATAAAIL